MGTHAVLELTDTEAKFLQVTRHKKTGIELDHAFTVDLSDLPRDASGVQGRASRLRDRLKALKLGQLAVAVVIPKQSAVVRSARLPSSDAVELKEMAQFEAEKFIPFNAERHIIGNMIQRIDGVEGSHVLIAAVDGPVMQNAVDIATGAGLEPVLAEISSVALTRAFQQVMGDTAQRGVNLLLNVGKSQTDITIIHDGLLVTTRAQALGTDKLLAELGEAMHLGRDVGMHEIGPLNMMESDAFLVDGGTATPWEEGALSAVGQAVASWLQRLVRFIRQTYEFAAREQGVPTPTAIYLCGEGLFFRGFSEQLVSLLGIEAHSFNPLIKVKRSPKGVVEEWALPGLAGAWGCALRLVEEEEKPEEKDARINLLPPALIEQQAASERLILLMISGTMVIITLILVYLAYDTQAGHQEELARRYREYNKEMQPLVEERALRADRLEIIDRISANRAGALAILDEVSRYPTIGTTKAGGRLTITEFKYSVDGEVTIAGDALEVKDINSFTDYLVNLEYNGDRIFEEVEQPAQNLVNLSRDRPSVYAFTIAAKLKQNEGETK